MKNQNHLFYTLLIACLSASNQSVTSANLQSTININDYNLVWQDEFDGNTLNTVKWNYRAENTIRNYATVSRNTIAMDGQGHVVISVTKDINGTYYVGELGTQGLFETTYGYFECRAKMNSQLGPHVAFWLQSPTMSTVGDPAVNGTEIDVFEYHRKTPTTLYHNLHWNGYGVDHQTIGKQFTWSGIDSGYHTFGLLWTKDSYTFFVDGVQTWQATTAVSRRSEYLILSTELTGWGGTFTSSTFPDNLTVDYVRVYKPKDVSTAATFPQRLSTLQIQPNLVKKGELVTISALGNTEKSSLSVYTIAGNPVKTFDVTPDINSQIKINTTEMTSGVYIIRYNNQLGKLVIR